MNCALQVHHSHDFSQHLWCDLAWWKSMGPRPVTETGSWRCFCFGWDGRIRHEYIGISGWLIFWYLESPYNVEGETLWLHRLKRTEKTDMFKGKHPFWHKMMFLFKFEIITIKRDITRWSNILAPEICFIYDSLILMRLYVIISDNLVTLLKPHGTWKCPFLRGNTSRLFSSICQIRGIQ